MIGKSFNTLMKQFPRFDFLRRSISTGRRLRTYGLRPGFTFLTYRERLAHRFAGLFRPKVIDLRFSGGPMAKAAKLTIRSGGLEGDLAVFAGVLSDQEYRHEAIASAKRVLDIGAHIGIAAVWLHLMNPKVELACVEPDPRNLDLLSQNLAQNGIDARVIRCAVSDVSGQMSFGIGANPSCSTLRSTHHHSHEESISVEVKTLPQILDLLGWDHVDLIKMDIEGAEGAVLESCRDWGSRVATLVMEIHPNVDIQQAASRLADCGFDLRPLGRGVEPTYVAVRT